MAERKVSVRLSVVDGGQFKAEMADLGAAGGVALGKLGADAGSASKCVGLTAQQIASLQFQLQDVAVGLASGQNPFTVMLQQGSQIVQMFRAETGVLGAIKAVGSGVVSFLTNPLNLALLGFAAATAAADVLFSTVTGPGEDAKKTLEDQEEIIGKIAERYGDALPQVKAYADEIERAKQAADLAEGQAAAISRAWSNANAIFGDSQGQIQQLFADLQLLGDIDSLAQLEHQVWGLEDSLKNNTATAEQAQRIHATLMQLFQTTGIPITQELATRFASLAAAIAGANAQAANIGSEFSQNVPAQGVLASLNEELANLGKTAEQLRIEKELRAANVDAATDEGKAIAAKVHEIFAEQQAQKDAAAASRAAASASRQSREQAAREVERQHETVKGLIESLKEEVEIEKTSDPVQQELIRLRGQMAGATAEERAKIEELIRAKIALQNTEKEDKSLYGAPIDYLKDFVEKAGSAADLIKEAISGAFSSAADAVAEFVRTGKVNFASLISSMLADLARLAVQQAVLTPLAKLLGGLLGGGGGIGSLIGGLLASANGNVFDQGRVLQFAGGGVVTSPTLFPMRGGLGLMGEAGPEAIMPLARGRDGKLGVRGGGANVTVNISTPDVESFRRARTQIAADIARAVSFGSRGL